MQSRGHICPRPVLAGFKKHNKKISDMVSRKRVEMLKSYVLPSNAYLFGPYPNGYFGKLNIPDKLTNTAYSEC